MRDPPALGLESLRCQGAVWWMGRGPGPLRAEVAAWAPGRRLCERNLMCVAMNLEAFVNSLSFNTFYHSLSRKQRRCPTGSSWQACPSWDDDCGRGRECVERDFCTVHASAVVLFCIKPVNPRPMKRRMHFIVSNPLRSCLSLPPYPQHTNCCCREGRGRAHPLRFPGGLSAASVDFSAFTT